MYPTLQVELVRQRHEALLLEAERGRMLKALRRSTKGRNRFGSFRVSARSRPSTGRISLTGEAIVRPDPSSA